MILQATCTIFRTCPIVTRSSSSLKRVKLKLVKDHGHHPNLARLCLDKSLLTKRFPTREYRQRAPRSGHSRSNFIHREFSIACVFGSESLLGDDGQNIRLTTCHIATSIKLVPITTFIYPIYDCFFARESFQYDSVTVEYR